MAGRRYQRYYRPTANMQLDSMGIAMPLIRSLTPSPTITFTPRRFFWNAQTGHLDSLRTFFDPQRDTLHVNIATPYAFRFIRDAEGHRTQTRYAGICSPCSLDQEYSTTHDLVRSTLHNDDNPYQNDLFSRRYGLDSIGRVDEVSQSQSATSMFLNHTVRKFYFDGIGQLRREERFKVLTDITPSVNADYGYHLTPENPDTTFDLVYDAAGNKTSITSSPSGAVEASTSTVGNRLQTSGPYRFEYDADGQMTRRYVDLLCCGRRAEVVFSWTADGRLSQARSLSTGDSVQYDYNALGQLVRKRRNGVVSRHFLWDGANLLAEIDSTGTRRIAEYVHLGTDEPFLLYWDADLTGQRALIQQDAMGNVIGTATSSAFYASDSATVITYADAWGNVSSATGPLADINRLRWKGLMWEGDITNLYYIRNRWYDPQAKRFISEDPVGPDGGLNEYAYAGNDPVNGFDPLGLSPLTGGDGHGRGGNPGMGHLDYLPHGSGAAEQLSRSAHRGGQISASDGAAVFNQLAGMRPAINRAVAEFIPTTASIAMTLPALGAAGVGGAVETTAATAPTRVFFAGGVYNAEGAGVARAAAEVWAQENGAITISETAEGIQAKAAAEGLDWYTEARPIWKEASEEYARNAAGDVHVFQGARGVSVQTLFRYEYEVLINNPAVRRIIWHIVF